MAVYFEFDAPVAARPVPSLRVPRARISRAGFITLVTAWSGGLAGLLLISVAVRCFS